MLILTIVFYFMLKFEKYLCIKDEKYSFIIIIIIYEGMYWLGLSITPPHTFPIQNKFN